MMILRQTLPQGGSLVDQIGIISRLWAIQGRLQLARVPHAMSATVAIDLVCMDSQNLDDGQIIRHSVPRDNQRENPRQSG